RLTTRAIIERHIAEIESGQVRDKLPSLLPGPQDAATLQPRTASGPQRTLPMAPPVPALSTPPLKKPSRIGRFVLAAAVAGALVGLGAFGAVKLRAPKAAAIIPVVPSAAAKVEPTCLPGMIKIEAGNFFMGSDDKDDFDFEKPAHKVTLSQAFCIDVF